MKSEELSRVRNRAKEQQKELREAVSFIDNIGWCGARMEDAGAEEVEVNTKVGGAISFVEISVSGYFENAEDAPAAILDERDWRQASLKPKTTGARLYVKDRIDLR